MLEIIQHALGLCSDHNSHINFLSIIGEQSLINNLINLLKFKIK